MTTRFVNYQYDECGLDNVVLENFPVHTDDAGEEVVTIPNVNLLHRVLVGAVAVKQGGLKPKEIRFLRSELGLSQAELAKLVGRDGQTVGRWERGETEIDQASEIVVRMKALEHAMNADDLGVDELAERSVFRAVQSPIRIKADDPEDYRPIAA
ncbi:MULTISPECIES: helix-turn-helix domain-containing protein [Hyphobacterium]|uniref:Helix-turn-helix domain-containing protein n=1 Tax=Hyphobacterium vulgare TaxID=1736751 RepID=A0ABV6ZUQ4_9PROT